MKLETILKEFSFGKKIKILDVVNSGTSRRCEILREIPLCSSTVDLSLRFLVDEGFLRRESERGKLNRRNRSYFITKKGTELSVLLDRIKILCECD